MKIRGIHDYCLKCNKVVTAAKSKCGKKKVLSINCPFKDKHKIQSRIWNPTTKKTDQIKTWQTRDIGEVIPLHLEFKKQTKDTLNKNSTPNKSKEKPKPNLLGHCMSLYMEWIEDVDVPAHKVKNLSPEYISAVRNQLKKFAKIAGPSTPIELVDESHIGAFHKSLDHLAPKTYNNNIRAINTFFIWLIKYGYEIKNPFEGITQKWEVKDPKMVSLSDLTTMLKNIKPENGKVEIFTARTGKTTTMQYYKPWLKHAIILFLMTGERRDGVFLVKWEHIFGEYIKIPNYKVNLANKIDIFREILITPDLADLLDSIGRKEEGYIIAPDRKNRKQIKQECTRGFTHFWTFSNIENYRSLKHLRKTYATKMRMELGGLAKALNINTDDTQFDYYIDKKEIQEKFRGKRIFELDLGDG